MEDIRRRLAYPDKEVPPSEKALPWGDRGRTPIFLGDQAAGALVAVIMDQIPPEIGASLSEQKLFENDGEMYFSKERIGTQTLYVKIYEVKREGNIATLIALFQPTDSRQVGLVRGFLPTKICYPFDETGMVMDLIRRGLPDDQARPFLPQLLQGGKIYFTGGQGKPVVVEMTGVNRWKSFEPPRVDPAVVNSASVPIYR